MSALAAPPTFSSVAPFAPVLLDIGHYGAAREEAADLHPFWRQCVGTIEPHGDVGQRRFMRGLHQPGHHSRVGRPLATFPAA